MAGLNDSAIRCRARRMPFMIAMFGVAIIAYRPERRDGTPKVK
jgi:hypothetical protein